MQYSLAFVFDSTVSFSNNIRAFCICIRPISHAGYPYNHISFASNCLDPSSYNALFSSRFDYCDSPLIGVSKENLHKLQMNENSLAMATTETRLSITAYCAHVAFIELAVHWGRNPFENLHYSWQSTAFEPTDLSLFHANPSYRWILHSINRCPSVILDMLPTWTVLPSPALCLSRGRSSQALRFVVQFGAFC